LQPSLDTKSATAPASSKPGNWVTVEPSGIRFEVHPDESVADAAWRHGLHWPTKCWGQLECMACFAKVLDGETAAVPMGEAEYDALRLRATRRLRQPMTRLACHLKIKGAGLVLEKVGVRPAEPGDNNMLADEVCSVEANPA
jgi:ferredoxin, 2Fe-2S